jgi:hypothetical protein
VPLDVELEILEGFLADEFVAPFDRFIEYLGSLEQADLEGTLIRRQSSTE